MTGLLFAKRLPGPEYRCLMADPPWPERGAGKVKRGADRHYGLIDTKEGIRDAILQSGVWRPAGNAHCHIWYTDNYLEWALWLLPELDFRYVRRFEWVKTDADVDEDDPEAIAALTEDELRMGIGQYARGCKEGWLFGVRGDGQAADVWTGNRSVRDVVLAPHVLGPKAKRIHSAKPPKAYERIESVSKGPRVELFARSGRIATDGERWDAWGNQAPTEGAPP